MTGVQTCALPILNEKEKDHYADYLESEKAPQYEIDAQRKMAQRRFIDASRDLPPADIRDTLSLRLSDFIRDLDGYEKDMLENVERTDLAPAGNSPGRLRAGARAGGRRLRKPSL